MHKNIQLKEGYRRKQNNQNNQNQKEKEKGLSFVTNSIYVREKNVKMLFVCLCFVYFISLNFFMSI